MRRRAASATAAAAAAAPWRPSALPWPLAAAAVSAAARPRSSMQTEDGRAAAPPPPPPRLPLPLPLLLLLLLALLGALGAGAAAVAPGGSASAGAVAGVAEAGGDANVCRSVAGLSREQLELCRRLPAVAAAALQGLQLAVAECQFQFQWHRWNCSSLSTKARNPHASVILQRGYRESAFARAITAAGVVHSVARACASGRLVSCSCDPQARRSAARRLGQSAPAPAPAATWKWGGCSHNTHYGLKFSKLFLDVRERAADMLARVNLHNNQAGRLAVSSNMQQRCKCHGVSGSCELRTCWQAAPPFRVVGAALKERFRAAVLVDQGNLGRAGAPLLPARAVAPARPRQRPRAHGRRRGAPGQRQRQLQTQQPKRTRPRVRPRPLDLLYFQRSPTFCDKDPAVDFPGTAGRRCARGSRGPDGCASMCCGRGYDERRERTVQRCRCRFRWCCSVACDNCTRVDWVTVCK